MLRSKSSRYLKSAYFAYHIRSPAAWMIQLHTGGVEFVVHTWRIWLTASPVTEQPRVLQAPNKAVMTAVGAIAAVQLALGGECYSAVTESSHHPARSWSCLGSCMFWP